MSEKSIYESTHPSRAGTAAAIAIGHITSVDPVNRYCTVKIIVSSNPHIQGKFIPQCQWLSVDSNPAGDEFTSVPRAKSICMVFFVNGEPYVFGFLKAINAKGQAITGKEVAQLTEGDKIISTVGGNYMKIGANGAIIIQSKETLKTIWFPTKSLLYNTFRELELHGDGGYITWKSDEIGNALWQGVFRNNLLNVIEVLEQKGSAGGTIVKRTAIGPGAGASSGIYSYEQTIDALGEVTTSIGPPGQSIYTSKISPTGDISVSNGGGQAFGAKVSPLGDMTLSIGQLVTIEAKVSGDFSVTTPTITIEGTAAGQLNVQATGQAKFDIDGSIELTTFGNIKLNAMATVTLSAPFIRLDGTGGDGSAAMFGVLTFPNVIDPLTGAPLGPGSATVLASK